MAWREWIRDVEVEPSLYAADFSRLGEEIEALLAAGARIFHFDIGDGHFVPPITVGPIVLRWIAPIVQRAGGALDCHLMTEAPQRHFAALAEAGGDSVTVHHEACDDSPTVARVARAHGLQVGLALNPDTPVEEVAAPAAGFDLVNCMSVYPGYSGQSFIRESIERVARLREILPPHVAIQVDGGVGPDNLRELREAGATLFVAATSIFGGADPSAAYRALTEALA